MQTQAVHFNHCVYASVEGKDLLFKSEGEIGAELHRRLEEQKLLQLPRLPFGWVWRECADGVTVVAHDRYRVAASVEFRAECAPNLRRLRRKDFARRWAAFN